MNMFATLRYAFWKASWLENQRAGRVRVAHVHLPSISRCLHKDPTRVLIDRVDNQPLETQACLANLERKRPMTKQTPPLFEVEYDYDYDIYVLMPTFDDEEEYIFDSSLEAKEFINHFYRNPCAAIFAYRVREGICLRA